MDTSDPREGLDQCSIIKLQARSKWVAFSEGNKSMKRVPRIPLVADYGSSYGKLGNWHAAAPPSHQSTLSTTPRRWGWRGEGEEVGRGMGMQEG